MEMLFRSNLEVFLSMELHKQSLGAFSQFRVLWLLWRPQLLS